MSGRANPAVHAPRTARLNTDHVGDGVGDLFGNANSPPSAPPPLDHSSSPSISQVQPESALHFGPVSPASISDRPDSQDEQVDENRSSVPAGYAGEQVEEFDAWGQVLEALPPVSEVAGLDDDDDMFVPHGGDHDLGLAGESFEDDDSEDGEEEERTGGQFLGLALESPPEPCNDSDFSPPSQDGGVAVVDRIHMTHLVPVSPATFEFAEFVTTCENGAGLSKKDINTLFNMHKSLGALPEFKSAGIFMENLQLRHAEVHFATGVLSE